MIERRIAASAVAPNSGYLNGVLLDVDIIRLIRAGMSTVSRNSNVDGVIENQRRVDERARKDSIAAVAGSVEARAKWIAG